jgi:hypothetical protein
MPNWKKVIVSGSNAVLNNITASGHMSVLGGGFTVNNLSEFAPYSELEVDGNVTVTNDISVTNEISAKYRKLDLPGDIEFNYNGDVVFFGTEGASFEQGKIVVYDGGGWDEASPTYNQGGIGVGGFMLGWALGNSVSDGILIRGFITLPQLYLDVLPQAQIGSPLYLGTLGSFNITPPSTDGHISRIIGQLVDNGLPKIYFNPSPDWIEIEA